MCAPPHNNVTHPADEGENKEVRNEKGTAAVLVGSGREPPHVP